MATVFASVFQLSGGSSVWANVFTLSDATPAPTLEGRVVSLRRLSAELPLRTIAAVLPLRRTHSELARNT